MTSSYSSSVSTDQKLSLSFSTGTRFYMIVCSCSHHCVFLFFFFFQAEDGIRDLTVTGVQTCALPICAVPRSRFAASSSRSRPMKLVSCRGRLFGMVAAPAVGTDMARTPTGMQGRSEERRVGKEV